MFLLGCHQHLQPPIIFKDRKRCHCGRWINHRPYTESWHRLAHGWSLIEPLQVRWYKSRAQQLFSFGIKLPAPIGVNDIVHIYRPECVKHNVGRPLCLMLHSCADVPVMRWLTSRSKMKWKWAAQELVGLCRICFRTCSSVLYRFDL